MTSRIERNDAGITTIKQAKALCVNKHGKLPRVGYESVIAVGKIGLNTPYRVYLQNNSGCYRVWQWTSVN